MSSEIIKPVEAAMRRFKAQNVLFEPHPNRVNLLSLELPPVASLEKTVVNVWRNHAFEPLQPLIERYAVYRNWELAFRLGGYDDSFSFGEFEEASVELLWMDSRRVIEQITFRDWLSWLTDRIQILRRLSTAPIVLATWLPEKNERDTLAKALEGFPSVFYADLGEECEKLNVQLVDERTEYLAGTPISNRAQVLLARSLTCKWLAGAILPPIKALALDLDNTLHEGVLGEDGLNGVKLTSAHSELQSYIKELQTQGIFISLVSRNELDDVRDLFTQRNDYPLKLDDFSAIEVSWGDKANALQHIAKSLRISTDAILFIDDNPGELAAVTQQLAKIHTLHADLRASISRLSIEYYPGLWRWRNEPDDSKRIKDLKASIERESLALTHEDPKEYLRSLEVSLTYFNDPKHQIGRLSDLCRKTNQFNLALSRFNEAELSDRMSNPNACVASVRLSDRLSDSGVIAVIVAERFGDKLFVEELCISCRALGRQLENAIIFHSIRQMPIWKSCKTVEFRVKVGDRNQPALDWLKGLFKSESFAINNLSEYVLKTDVINLIQISDELMLINGGAT